MQSPCVDTASRSRRGNDPYDELEPLLHLLHALEPGEPRRARVREEIIRRCLPLAEHIARRYTGRGIAFDDLEQVARVGVVLAVDRFDSAQGHAFLAFAVPTVLGEVRRYFRDCGWTVQVPRRLKDMQQRVTTVVPGLTQRLGRTPTRTDLATELGVGAEEVDEALLAANGYRTDSLDALVDNDETTAVPRDGTLGAWEPCYELLEDAIAVRPFLRTLPERDRTMLILRFYERQTQAEIGKQLGMSQMKVSRVLTQILRELRDQALEETSLPL